ncbi:HD domain-containing protein [Varunaivibrio sulfuroxidans]|uniref:Metal dependent phosphohydrolase n=1 Tax=Varunaivibrio sulfuroxidans TaxID=1773489 RepID=A0A4R3JCQ1_9PROT|nr:HD domain-containing protein [Varunaivibrio sulfuroxidans]TCS62460.1 metal dependent phosphohydrolase [Varunaivibrio sulfuroxidans]WES30864.1 HD domain-containing protein [Varunaivibrio sulfuroxidans]
MELTEKFEDALSMAARLHGDQKRKGTDIPYLSHLMAVAAIVLENGGDENEAIAALLHDAVEDQGGAPVLVRIRERFGDDVADIVASCSDTDVTPKPPWRERKQAYIDTIARKSPSARLVSLADKLHNIHTIDRDYRRHGEALWKRFNAGKEEQLWYYRGLAKAFMARGDDPLARELDNAVRTLEKLCA